MRKLKEIIFAIFYVPAWIVIHPYDEKCDRILREWIKSGQFAWADPKVPAYVVLNWKTHQSVWVHNYPYGYGATDNVWDDMLNQPNTMYFKHERRPSRLTAWQFRRALKTRTIYQEFAS